MSKPSDRTTIGVISDTHGLVRTEALTALKGVDALIHAGDVGKPEVLDELRQIAPVTVIRGNVDHWATRLADTEALSLHGRQIFILHNLAELSLDPKAAGYDVVIYGHSHQPRIATDDGVLYLNPGSAGPRRFSLPVTVAKLELSDTDLKAEIIELEV